MQRTAFLLIALLILGAAVSKYRGGYVEAGVGDELVVLSGQVANTDRTPIGVAEIVIIPTDSEGKAKKVAKKTDERGGYWVRVFPYRYSIKVTCKGYRESECIRILSEDMNQVDFKLKPKRRHAAWTVVVAGFVRDTGGNPIPEAKVVATPTDEKKKDAKMVEVNTDDKGKYEMRVFPYRYNIKVAHEAYKQRELEKEILTKDRSDLNFRLERKNADSE